MSKLKLAGRVLLIPVLLLIMLLFVFPMELKITDMADQWWFGK
jgi:hypothetical protein